MRKTLIIVMILGAALLIAGTVAFIILSKGQCLTQRSPELLSLENDFLVALVEMNCHSTSPYVTDVVLTKLPSTGSGASNNRRSVFAIRGRIDDIALTWSDNNSLKVNVRGCPEVYRQESSWNEVKILFANECE